MSAHARFSIYLLYGYNSRVEIRRRGKIAVIAYMDALRDLKNFVVNVR